MATRTVSVDLVANVGQYQSAMTKAAKTTASVGTAATEAGTRADKGFAAAGRGAGLLTAAIGGGLVLGLKGAIDASADAEQSIGGVQAVFKDYARSVIASSQQADRQLGLSANSYRELATVIGSQLKNAQVPMEELSDRTESVIQTGADLAAQFGGSTQEAVEALSSAFRGELDPIEKYGISLSAARVGAKAVELGLAESATELDQNAKLMATLALVTEQSADAQGAFAREADTASGRAQRAAAQWENLKVAIGDELLPVWSGLVDVLGTDVIPALGVVVDTVGGALRVFGELPGPVQAATLAALGWAVAGDRILNIVRPMGGVLGGLRGGWQSFGEALDYARKNGDGLGTVLRSVGEYAGGQGLRAVKAFGRAVGPELAVAGTALLVGEIVSEFRDLGTAGETARAKVEALRKSLEDLDNGSRGDATARGVADLRDELDKARAIVREAEQEGWFDEFVWQNPFSDDYYQGVADARKSVETYEAAIEEFETKQRNADSATALLSERLNLSKGEVVDLADKYGVDLTGSLDTVYGRFLLARASVEGTDGAMTNANSSAGQFAAEMDAVAEAADNAKRQTDQFKLSLDILTGAHVSMIEVESAYQAAVDEAAGAVDDLKGQVLQANGQFDLQSEAGRKASEVLLGVKDSGNQLIATMIQQGASTEQVIAKDRQLREGFIQSAMQMGISREAAEKLADQILGIPAERETKIKADTAQANAAIADTQTRIDNLHGKTVLVSVKADGTVAAILGSSSVMSRPGVVVGFAGGGYTGPGGKYTPAGVVHGNEYVEPSETVDYYRGTGILEALHRRTIPRDVAASLPGYADGGIVVNFDPNPLVTTVRGVMSAIQEPAYAGARALAFARSQVGKPYIWGGVGPSGYDCSGFMSALTNVARGRYPYSRVGSTASFPWAGFAPGYGFFTIGSTRNAGGGIGHMAGTVNGVAVESTGGIGVRVGGSARSASNGLFTTRAHLAMAGGGVIGEPVVGRGMWSGRSYSFAERGDEVVLPRSRETSGRYAGSPVVKIMPGDLAGMRITGAVTVNGLDGYIDGVVSEAFDLASQRGRHNG